MTEQLGEHNENVFERMPEEFESTLVDPYVTRLFTQAHEYADIISTVGNTTPEERIELINELDAKWPYLRQQMTVSGAVTFKIDSDSPKVKEYYDGEPMVSNGFCFIEDHLMMDGEIIEERYRAALHLIQYVDPEKTKCRFGVGELDEVVLDYPMNSSELIENRLRYYYPDMMEDLDGIVLNCNSEEEAFMSLKDFSLDAAPEDPFDSQMISDIDGYLSSVLEIDDQLPYALKVEGKCFFVREDGAILGATFNSTTDAVVSIRSINLLAVGDTSERKKVTLVPVVNVDFFNKSKTSDPSHLYIPCSSILDAYSLRRLVYEKGE